MKASRQGVDCNRLPGMNAGLTFSPFTPTIAANWTGCRRHKDNLQFVESILFAEKTMKQLTEQSLAKAYLVHRDKNYSAAFILNGAIIHYVIQAAFFLLFAIGAFTLNTSYQRGLCLFCAGMGIGSFIRDAGWFRRMKTQWPLIHKFIDWPKVEAIAKQEQ